MSNPYQPPELKNADASEREHAKELRRVEGKTFGQEIGAAALVAAGLGLLVGIAILSANQLAGFVFIAPALGWIILFSLYLVGIRKRPKPFASNLALATVLTVPAYILYIPVCTVGSMLTTPILGGIEYGPKPAGVVVASVFTFVAITLLVASIIRARGSAAAKQPSGTSE